MSGGGAVATIESWLRWFHFSEQKRDGCCGFIVQCPASFGFMDSDAVLGLCSVVLLRLAFGCDRSLARFDFPTPLQLFFLVDPFLMSLIHFFTHLSVCLASLLG